jgi:hypothetical protein
MRSTGGEKPWYQSLKQIRAARSFFCGGLIDALLIGAARETVRAQYPRLGGSLAQERGIEVHTAG